MLKFLKVGILLFLFFYVKGVNAQYNIIVNEPASQFTFNQLWNFNINYSGTVQGLDHYVEVRLSEEHDGLLLNVKTNTFKVYTGGVYFSLGSINLLQPFNINIVKSIPYSDLVYSGGMFPSGKYTASYSLYKVEQGAGQLVDNYSFDINVESFGSVIQLNVFDKDTIDTYNPTFNWVYSNLQVSDPRAIFKFKLVELNEGQSPFDAIYFNNTYLEETLLNSVTNLQYPNSARKLQKGKSYAWQVTVMNNGLPIAQSEVWTFTIRDIKDEPLKPIWYFDAINTPNSSYSIVKDNLLHIRYVAKFKDKDNALSYRILDSNNKVVLDDKQLPLSVSYGDNRYEINLCNYRKKIKDGLFVFEITDDLGQKWYVNFNNENNNCN